MSSLLRKRITQRPAAPGRMWLGALAAVGLLSTVLCLGAAGMHGAATASLTTAAARAAAAPAAAAPAAAARTSSGSTARTASRGVVSAAMTTPTTKTVMIENYAFVPATLTIDVGDTVTWTNMDTAPHTVTVSSGPVTFTSGNLAKGQSFTYTFTEAGTYQYYCAVHPDMTASVTVVGSSTTPTPTPTPMPPASSCGGLQAAVDAFLQHFYAAHLETSPTQQLSDAMSIDPYTKTHTVLIENMLKPVIGGAQSSLDAFLQHVYAAHLETSPTQQVSDALALSQYIKTHTVMIENMVKPLAGQDMSSC